MALIWIVGAVWITLAAPSVRDLGTADQTAFVPADAPSGQADALLRSAFPDDPTRDPAVIVLGRGGGLQPTDRAYIAELAQFLGSPAAATHVKGVQSAASNPELSPVLQSPDGAAELIIVSIHAQIFSVSSERTVSFLRDHVAATAPPGLQVEVTGLAALGADQATATVEAFDKTAVATIVLVLLILVVVYRSAVAPLISLVTIGCAFLVARGLAGYAAQGGLEVHSLAETFMIVMAFGAGTDYAMFVLSRYREEARSADEASDDSRLVRATSAVSPTVVASAATVTVGFLAFLAGELGIVHSFGPVLGVAVAVTGLASLTLTPALIRLAGRAVFWPTGPNPTRTDRMEARWRSVADLVGRRPVAVLLVSVAVLALPAAAATQTKTSFDIPSELPADAEARQGFELLAAHYPPGALAPAFVVISADQSLLERDRLAAIDRLTDRLRAVPGVAEVRSVTQPAGAPLTNQSLAEFTGGETDLNALGIDPNRTDVGPLLGALSSPEGLRISGALLRQYPDFRERLGYFLGTDDRTTRIVVAFDSSPYAQDVLNSVRDLDNVAADALAGSEVTDARIAIGGPSAYFADIDTLINGDLRTVGALVIALIMIVLALLVRSVIAPLYLLFSVLLSMFAALGITTLVFQGMLGHEGLAFYLPILLFVMLIALGSDYNIFIVGRIREELDAGHSVREATTRALVSTGPTITAAGFVLAGTFAALLITPLPSVRQIGFGVAVGVLIDTFIVRSLLVPAATVLLGRFAFWPSTGLARTGTRPRLAIAGSMAGLLALAIALPGLAFAVREDLGVTQVPPPAAAAAAAGAVAPQATAAAPTTTPKATARARPTAAPTVSPAPKKKKRSVEPSPAPQPTQRPGVATPTRIAAPLEGRWTYRVEGTRKVGAAGSDQPFAEDADTVVTRTGGGPDRPEFALHTETSFATTDETRRYTSGSVDALSLKANALGLSYGGTFDPPQQLIRRPIRIGESWTSRWKAGGTRGESTSTVTGTRPVTIEGRRLDCYIIERTTTMSGDVTGTQRQRTCWLPTLGMPAIDEQELQGTYQGITFKARATMTLTEPPAGSPERQVQDSRPDLASRETVRRSSRVH
ncbi:MMPL family transporter [Sporichthya polymorpha]|uniref:MMPL family transporter n=1 Tax=Sporichthya polymorpha TaxID=35751 RepID=UPI00037DA2EC|nr:MMPL family transporter [Sporichthya polymorpha]